MDNEVIKGTFLVSDWQHLKMEEFNKLGILQRSALIKQFGLRRVGESEAIERRRKVDSTACDVVEKKAKMSQKDVENLKKRIVRLSAQSMDQVGFNGYRSTRKAAAGHGAYMLQRCIDLNDNE